MAPTQKTSQKPFQSTTVEPRRRRSSRTLASGMSQPRDRVSIQYPQQHFLPRPEHAVDSVGFANPEPGGLSQQFDSAQIPISITQTPRQSNIQRGSKTIANEQMKSSVVQKVIKSKDAKARTTGKQTRARAKADAREQRARQQVQRLIEDAETAAGLNLTARVAATGRGTAAEPLPCSDRELDVIKQHEFVPGTSTMEDPRTPIHQTPEEPLTSPPAVSRSPQYKHHGYMEIQASPSGQRGSLRGREPRIRQLGDDIVLPPGIICKPLAAHSAGLDDVSTRPRTSGTE